MWSKSFIPFSCRRISYSFPAFTFCSGIIAIAIEFSAEHNFSLVLFAGKYLSILTPFAWVHNPNAHLIFVLVLWTLSLFNSLPPMPVH
jgi:hypothetical protein